MVASFRRRQPPAYPRTNGTAANRQPPGRILAGAQPPFHTAELRLATRHEFGSVHLPDPAEIRSVALRLRNPKAS